MSTLTVSSVGSVRLTVASAAAHETTSRLASITKNKLYTSVVSDLPVANDYTFTAEALDMDDNVIARGTASKVAIAAGATAKVIIYLNELAATTPFANASPHIDGIALSSGSIEQGGQVALSATAHDPDSGQTATLSFSWIPSAACGTMSAADSQPGSDVLDPSQSRATWTAPSNDGTCPVTLTVTDTLGLTDSVTFTIHVVSGRNTGPGNAGVATVFDDAPTIRGLTASPGQLFTRGDNGGVLHVEATDPDGDTLTYAWSAPEDSPCTFTFGTPDAASTTFALSGSVDSTRSCTFLVTIGDGVLPGTVSPKNASTASLTLAVTEPIVVQTPPEFSVVFQSDNFASGGKAVKFAAVAHDPGEGQVTFAWSASAGSSPLAATPASLGLDPTFTTAATWTAPAGIEDSAEILTVTVTATNPASSLASSWTFSLVPANLQ